MKKQKLRTESFHYEHVLSTPASPSGFWCIRGKRPRSRNWWCCTFPSQLGLLPKNFVFNHWSVHQMQCDSQLRFKDMLRICRSLSTGACVALETSTQSSFHSGNNCRRWWLLFPSIGIIAKKLFHANFYFRGRNHYINPSLPLKNLIRNALFITAIPSVMLDIIMNSQEVLHNPLYCCSMFLRTFSYRWLSKSERVF